MNNNETTIRVSEFIAQIQSLNKPVDVITTLNNPKSEYTATYPCVPPIDIKYVYSVNRINIGGWRDSYDVVLPAPDSIQRKEIGEVIIYTARTSNLVTDFVVGK